MISCLYCNKKFKNNLGGDLTVHLFVEHNKTLEEYVINFEYSGIIPKCACGLCDEKPLFSRGKFKNYATGHFKNSWVRKKLIENFGEPKCKNCGASCGFNRKEPKEFCSKKCSGELVGGFNSQVVQNKIKTVVKEKYGVEFISQLDYIREKISKANKGRIIVVSEETKKKISIASKKNWQNEEFKKKTSKSIKDSLNTKDQRAKRSRLGKDKCKDDIYLQKQIDKLLSMPKRLSKLHIKIRKILNLNILGFVSEQKIDRFIVDELNEREKIILEINGDYVHANPKFYKEDDLIRLPGLIYTAKEKWNYDYERKIKLESLGYKVITIWESDNLEEMKNGFI